MRRRAWSRASRSRPRRSSRRLGIPRANASRSRFAPATSSARLTAEAAEQLGIEACDPGRRRDRRCLGELPRRRDDCQGRRDRRRRRRRRLRGLLGSAGPRARLVRDDRAAARACSASAGRWRRPAGRSTGSGPRSSSGVDSTEALARGGGRDAARRRRRAVPAVPRRRALADLGPDGPRRIRRADARSPARSPDAGDPRGVRVRDSPRRRADPRRRDPGRRDAGLRRSGPQRDLEPDQGRRHRFFGRRPGRARDGGGRGGDSRGDWDRRVSGCPGGDPRHDPRRPSADTESSQPRRSTMRRSTPTSGSIRRSRRSSQAWRGRPDDVRRPAPRDRHRRRVPGPCERRPSRRSKASASRSSVARSSPSSARTAAARARSSGSRPGSSRRSAAQSRSTTARSSDRTRASGSYSRSPGCSRGGRSPTTSRTRSSWPAGHTSGVTSGSLRCWASSV